MLTVLATSKQRDQRIPAFIALILHMMTGPVMVSGLFLLTAPLTAGAVLILVSANLGTRKVSSNMLEIFPFVVGYMSAALQFSGPPKHPKWLPINFRGSEKVGPKCGTTSVKLNNDLDEAKTTISKSNFLQHVLYTLIFSLVLILSRLLL